MALSPMAFDDIGNWIDIKQSGISGTVKYRKDGAFNAIHVNNATLTGTRTYVKIGQLPNGAPIPSEKMFLPAVNGGLYNSVIRITETGEIDGYIPDSSSTNLNIFADIIYMVYDG